MGLIIILPFIIIDLAISNLIIALGANNIEPILISLPLKLILFISLDGWNLIINKILSIY